MKHLIKRLLALFLVLAMALAILPAEALAAANGRGDLWEQIIAYENASLKKSRRAGTVVSEKDYAMLSAKIAELVAASPDYTAGTCTYDGSSATFFWEDADGEPQIYAPGLRAKIEKGATGMETENLVETVSYVTAADVSSSQDVYVIGPWYGMDSSFTKQYQNEGKSIASAIGGTYTLYQGSSATIDNVARAMENGAVVIFDSHGTTDYEKELNYTYPDDRYTYVYDCVTRANTSYLTLTTGTGLTSADKTKVSGDFGTYYHAASFVSGDGEKVYCVDGTVIANHMTQKAPDSLLWMAICLGMATDGICAPMREQGVHTVYGYSQSVTFDGDYTYESSFWQTMKDGSGASVAEAISSMKAKSADWDPAYAAYSYYDTLAEARKYYVAFPVVVSPDDPHPGQRTASSYGADSLQAVQSQWSLYKKQYRVQAVSNNTAYGTVSVSDHTITCFPAEGYYVAGASITSGSGQCSLSGNVVTVVPASDCTVTVTFAPKPVVTVSFHGDAEAVCGYAGEPVILPDFSGTVPTDWGFLGWVEEALEDALEDAMTEAPAYFKAGDSYTAMTDTALYALYARTDSTTGTTCYMTHVDSCGHRETVIVGMVEATCVTDGYTGDAFCTSCGQLVSRGEVIPANASNCPSSHFIDLNEMWYHTWVDYVVENGLMQGMSAKRFGPRTNLTRAQVVTILYRMAGMPTAAEEAVFTDLEPGAYYIDAVNWGFEHGIVLGVSSTKFGPEQDVTREQLVCLMARYARYMGVDTTADSVLSGFSDIKSLEAYAVADMTWAVQTGIIGGMGNGKLDPKGYANRGQAAKIIAVLHKLLRQA